MPVGISGLIMKHSMSKEDQAFQYQVETCEFPVAEFDHRAHIRLAYVYLTENSESESVHLMRETLTALLRHVGIDPSQKYHETLTVSWIRAVAHFMRRTDDCLSAGDFIEKNTVMLDSKIMMTHYSTEVLFSDDARKAFVEPDLSPIPRQ